MRPAQAAALHQRFTPAPLALAAAMATALAAGHAPLAHAQANAAAASAPVAINLPAQPLGQALNALAQQANLQMSFPAALVAGKQAPAVAGNLTPRQALDRLLAGSGLVASLDGAAVVVRAAPPAAQAGEATLPAVTVTAGTEVTPNELPASMAGGQVAKGARLKMLGNADVMTTPFSVKSYTNELIQNQGARSVDDVVANDPSVRVSLSPGFVLDQSSIRGFVIFAGAYTIDGHARHGELQPHSRPELRAGGNLQGPDVGAGGCQRQRHHRWRLDQSGAQVGHGSTGQFRFPWPIQRFDG